MSLSRNEFGPVVQVEDEPRVVQELGIKPTDRVLEVGGGGNPFRRANVVCDLTFGESSQRNGAPGEFRDDVQYVEANAEELPFGDKEFDFVWSTQVFEHVADPIKAAAEVSRVAKRGFIEVPSRLGEMACGNPSHRWVIDLDGNTMVFYPRHFIEHPFKNFFYGTYFKRKDIAEASAGPFRNVFNHQVVFGEEGLKVRVMPAEGTPFNYDDPTHAARAHYSFARNCLEAGTDASYCLSDARLAARLLPDSVDARVLLAVHEARMLRFDEALGALEDIKQAPAPILRTLIQRLRAGEPLDPNSLPIPAAEIIGGTPNKQESTRVAVLCVGEDGRDLVQAAESALTQDHPDVRVIVAGPIDPSAEAWQRLQMGGRLKLVPTQGGGEGVWLNQAAAHVRTEWVGFCLAGDRLMADHVGRLLAQVRISGSRAIHSDQLMEVGGGVVSANLRAGNPAASVIRISSVLVHVKSALENGPFTEERGESAPTAWLTKLSTNTEFEHLEEVTLRSRASVPSGPEVLDLAASGMRLNPYELVRDLMSAVARERGLEARVRDLEQQLAERTSE